MRRAEKRKKFQDALIKSHYPQSPERQVQGNDETPAFAPTEEFDVNLIPDDYGLQIGGPSSGSSDNEGDGGAHKLTRAQRKRLRRKKIKEDVIRRKGIIGPLLPPGEAESSSPGVRQNAQESREGVVDDSKSRGEPLVETPNASRRNQRRRAKKLAKEKSRAPCSNVGDCATSLDAADEGTCANEQELKSTDDEN